jgi:tRNA(Ile)-lysidine synthase
LTRKATGKRLSLPGGVTVMRSYSWGYLQREPFLPARSFVPPMEVVVPGKTMFDEMGIETEMLTSLPPQLSFERERSATDVQIQYLDGDRISVPITVRYRRAGDCFRPLGMQGQKTLKKFFIDRKIPGDKRNRIPLFEDQHGIFWVVGYSIDERVKLTNTTQKILRCRVYQRVKSNA